MRSDYALYAAATIFFAITGISFLVLTGFEMNLSVVATAILGLFFVGLGYTQRPRTSTAAVVVPPSPPPEKLAETVQQERMPAIVENALPRKELTAIKGIKEKRATQLRALGINSVEELANASPKGLAAKLKMSPKFTQEWINSARKLVEKT